MPLTRDESGTCVGAGVLFGCFVVTGEAVVGSGTGRAWTSRWDVGAEVGFALGDVGAEVGFALDGLGVLMSDGLREGSEVGATEGNAEGSAEGEAVGCIDETGGSLSGKSSSSSPWSLSPSLYTQLHLVLARTFDGT